MYSFLQVLKMKTALVLVCLAFALAGASEPAQHVYNTKPIDATLQVELKKILELFEHPDQVNTEAEYYKIGKEYDIEAHISDYNNTRAVQEFLKLWKMGFMPKNTPFSIFYERQREEVVALFHVFFYAKDFDTFYKTAAWARVYINEGQFLYAYYIALIHRVDIKGVVVPAPYEVYPKLFTNSDVWYKIFRTKMQNGTFTPDFGTEHGVVHEGDHYVIYSNYSDFSTYHNYEYKISYFTEDIGVNAYYYFFHSFFPFWMSGDVYPQMKDLYSNVYYYFYQQLLARYYLERLSNGLGEIPDFSWWHPIKTGYSPNINYLYPFVQRPSYYTIPYEKNEELQLLNAFEITFIQQLQQGHCKFYEDINLRSKKTTRDSYFFNEVTARRVLGAAPKPVDDYTFVPTALDFYQTSLRDPIFYQWYSKILKYFVECKNLLPPYTQDDLHYVGVKISDVQVDKLVTYYDYYDFDVTKSVFLNEEELKTGHFPYYVVRQPRLNHRAFTVTVDIKSDVEGDAAFKIFVGPKYDSQGYPINLEDNWQNFVEWDWFVHKLVKGQNKIQRVSTDFFFYKEDSVPMREILRLISESKVPTDMAVKSGAMPNRLVLPKGTKGGFPYQLFVMVYPYTPAEKTFESIETLVMENKPFGYPFDRPVHNIYFKQPNMYFEDVEVYHEGEEHTYKFNTPHYNEVVKH